MQTLPCGSLYKPLEVHTHIWLCLFVLCVWILSFAIMCMLLTGIVRLPCKLLMAAWASACPWNFTNAHPVTNSHWIKNKNEMKHFVVLYLSAFYLCWCHQALSRQYTHLCCQRAQTAFWRPHRFAAFPACPQITSCPLRGQGCVEEREENVMNSMLYSQCWRHGWYRVKAVFSKRKKTIFLWQIQFMSTRLQYWPQRP